MSILPKIRIVLVETSHSGNIGAVARAMKNMGLGRLYLVAPNDFPSDQAYALSSHAEDVLDHAVISASLAEAIADCQLVFGTSARERKVPWPLEAPRQMAQRVMSEHSQHEIAVVFGRERTGLTNQELQCCHYHVHIPTNEEYSSLNLAQAVQVIAYELRLAALDHNQNVNNNALNNDNNIGLKTIEQPEKLLASSAQMEGFYLHLEKLLRKIHFLDEAQEGMLMLKLRRLYQRSRVEEAEMHILRGILSKMERRLDEKGKSK
ncbi:RNA methyltransferase [Piscirickettsia salmonis]|uniref:tRNA (cytidine/uridine-2'-O-)-methyltransferase TrmJ n=1 Tax=Piscirickettsia salmonis TaxID=1238 RepID=A0A9Q6LTX2_PISSA|nr:tRNA (cytosine(32)/uridine(32)-2'-O)-methyltransferase TrmJ [Piscirickettsia salmonis]ALA24482.1 RNA methyltransferase TrmH [Piscirickettsia salmonis]APS44838.1 RNA methyltransferase [Piscirickettsia salmonis]APS48199.1 RNA methyltransferase [Piscirickettsia salmonis]APS49468.1 RNA methyltransferase [Piscirickettsia salmonis]APS52644.1 RNA methyltransferase [Piscirickettsia salmonis]